MSFSHQFQQPSIILKNKAKSKEGQGAGSRRDLWDPCGGALQDMGLALKLPGLTQALVCVGGHGVLLLLNQILSY